MSKRTPGGRAKKLSKEKRRVAPPTRVSARGVGPIDDSAQDEPTQAALPARAAPPAAPTRQSLLAGVRRPARAAGPTLITDYGYVLSDLRRIGIVAAGAFALLIVLTFVIR